MRIKHKVNAVISADTAGKDKLLALDDAAAEVTLDGFQEHCAGTVSIAAAASFTVPLGGIADVRGLFLKATGDFTMSLNGGPAITVKRGHTGPSAAVATTARVLMEAQLTSIQVTATQALVLTHAVWGDPVA